LKAKIPKVKGLKEIIDICESKKAEDMVILDMRKCVSFTEYFVIASAESAIQARAVITAIEEKLKKKHIVYHTEGYEEGNWILLDMGHIIVHLFLKELREFYNLELLWLDAPRVKYGKTTA
jgi:ribosome-associated protein